VPILFPRTALRESGNAVARVRERTKNRFHHEEHEGHEGHEEISRSERILARKARNTFFLRACFVFFVPFVVNLSSFRSRTLATGFPLSRE
jgi:hypothetical protein